VLLIDDIERKIKYLVKNQNQQYVKLIVHPFVESFIKKGRFFNSIQWKWYWEYKRKIHVSGSNEFNIWNIVSTIKVMKRYMWSNVSINNS
jgi:ribonuclease G